MKRRIVIGAAMLLLVSLLLAGCNPSPTELDSEEVDATPDSGTALYSDDFSDQNRGWDIYSQADGRVWYQDGWIHLLNYTDSGEETDTRPHRYFTDFVLEVETKLVDGSDDNWHTVSVRLDDEFSYYEFSISADGFYRLAVWINDVDIDPSNTPTFSSRIRQGQDVVNLMRVEAVGNSLRLSVNGYFLTEMTDVRLTAGDIYLGTTSLAGTSTEIAFDNLVITKP